jgi:hypothetical protein
LGIRLVMGALGYIFAFGVIARIEGDPELWCAAAFGTIPLTVGVGYFLDCGATRGDLSSS